MTNINKLTLGFFNVMVCENTTNIMFKTATNGYITNFIPTQEQKMILEDYFKPLPINTLFSVEERENFSIDKLISKQILHYIEVYGLNSPGLFNLVTNNGTAYTINYVEGVSVSVLEEMIQKLLYTNAPIKNSEDLKTIIEHFDISYDINQIKNNEMRFLLFRSNSDVFTSGDDFVRYICHKATGSSLLIKSKEVIQSVSVLKVNPSLLKRHVNVLAQVFNRHKPLILALKNESNSIIINEVSRLSKKLHVPIREHISKRFITEALSGDIEDIQKVLDEHISLRDKFKYLNLLEYKKAGNDIDAFVIRNGKVHIEKGRKTSFEEDLIDEIQGKILDSISGNLIHLKNKKILLDEKVLYGLPISRKQTIGKLPFGSKVFIDGDISSGIYWKNSEGVRDLDLSAIDTRGSRTGWGQYSGYSNSNPITYSGDVTSAPNGAMEFMTSKSSYKETYGLFVNIFDGEVGSQAEVVVGDKSKDQWIKNIVLREKIALQTRGSIIGFVSKGVYTAYYIGMNNGHISGDKKCKAIISRGISPFWTINDVFDLCGIEYDQMSDGSEYDYDLSYNSFSYDKLENLLKVD